MPFQVFLQADQLNKDEKILKMQLQKGNIDDKESTDLHFEALDDQEKSFSFSILFIYLQLLFFSV